MTPALRRLLLLFVICTSPVLAQNTTNVMPGVRAGRVERVTFRSQALGVTKSMLVYLPPSYGDAAASARRWPVAVYLHGSFGSETDWTAQGQLATTMDSLVASGMRELIVVMPDGDDGWWTTWHSLNDVAACRRVPRQENADTYCVPWPKYDDYVTHDVLAFTDSAYRTVPRRASRAIAGLSMGGYGAISIAARSPQLFAVAASHSGVLRPALMHDSSTFATTGSVLQRDARTRDELRAASGGRWERIQVAFGSDSVAWMARDPSRLLARLLSQHAPMPALYVDIGTDDALLTMNRSFRDAITALQVPLTYRESSGRHDWAYWRRQLVESLQFIAERMEP